MRGCKNFAEQLDAIAMAIRAGDGAGSRGQHGEVDRHHAIATLRRRQNYLPGKPVFIKNFQSHLHRFARTKYRLVGHFDLRQKRHLHPHRAVAAQARRAGKHHQALRLLRGKLHTAKFKNFILAALNGQHRRVGLVKIGLHRYGRIAAAGCGRGDKHGAGRLQF